MSRLPDSRFLLEMPFARGSVETLEYSNASALHSQPTVSVVILAFAHEPYLATTIEGVLKQETAFKTELLVGEDHSPDRSLDIALNYQARHPDTIRVVTAQANVGARKNLYRCERLSRGKYIAYCEGDDYWHTPDKLQQQVEYLESHPECGLVYTNADTYHVLSRKRTPMAIPYRPELCDSPDPFIQQLTGVRTIWPLTVCVRKALVDEITRDCPEITDPVPPMGDTQRYLEIARRAAIHYMPVSTATRNLLPESATQSQSITRRARFVYAGGEMTLHYLEKYPVPERYDRQIRRWVHLRDLAYAYQCLDGIKARHAFKALREKRISIPLKHRMYYYGTRNRRSHRWVSVLLTVAARLVGGKREALAASYRAGSTRGIASATK